jgi:hypothetical protein
VTDELRRLADRAEIIELVARYNKAYFEFDAEAYGGTATVDGRYLQANTGWCAFGREEIASAIQAIPAGGGHQHLCGDHIVRFDGPDRAVIGFNMFIYVRESTEGPNGLWASGYYYNTALRTAEGWRFSEILSFIDRRPDDYVLANLRATVFARPHLSDLVTGLLGVSNDAVRDHVLACRPLADLAATNGIDDDALVDQLATALQASSGETNPLPRGAATAIAHVLTHDQVLGVEVEDNFRRHGWNGPAYSTVAT